MNALISHHSPRVIPLLKRSVNQIHLVEFYKFLKHSPKSLTKAYITKIANSQFPISYLPEPECISEKAAIFHYILLPIHNIMTQANQITNITQQIFLSFSNPLQHIHRQSLGIIYLHLH